MSRKLLKYFLKLGATGFGGPLALIQQMRKDLVESEKLIEPEKFDQAFTLIKALPGPIAFQMAVHCGHRLNGFYGAMIAGFGLICPAFIMMLFMGLFYTQITHVSQAQLFFTGMQYAVAAVILLGLKNFIVNYKKSFLFWSIVLLSAILFFKKIIPESFLIVGFGLMAVLLNQIKTRNQTFLFSVVAPILVISENEKLFAIFKTCFTAGALVFGTGLAVFPFFQAQFVDHLNWLPLSVFNDGVTFGQMTPGPVTISTTFFGYQMAGFSGAFCATLGLLIPPFFHMTTWFPRAMTWMSKQKWIVHFILGSTAAVVGCLLMTVYKMNSNEIHLFQFWIIFIPAVLTLYFKPKISILKILLFSGVIHLILGFLS
jgi:chromate transporter